MVRRLHHRYQKVSPLAGGQRRYTLQLEKWDRLKYNLLNTLSDEAINDPDYFDRKDLHWPDESMTMEIAAAWSVNTQNLEDRKDMAPGVGLVGVLQ